MEFVNPGFLYGLLAVAVPVIIHLFNFRRFKKVYFTNVAFSECPTPSTMFSYIKIISNIMTPVTVFCCRNKASKILKD